MLVGVNQRELSPARVAINRLIASLSGLGVTIIVAAVGGVISYYPLKNTHDGWQWLFVFLLMMGESAGIHLPSEVILPLAGWLIVKEHALGLDGLIAVSLVAALANTAGSGALYAAGRHGGRALLRRYGHLLQMDEGHVESLEARMRRYRWQSLFAARVLPVV